MRFRLFPFFILLALCISLPASAQWRAGVNVGASWNHYSIDKHYMTDWHYEGAWGPTFGVSVQYDFADWLAVRGDLSFTQKNFRQYRTGILEATNYLNRNTYLQLPVMASFSFGSPRLRGFLNLGVYGGYWLKSTRKGSYFNISSISSFPVNENRDFNSQRDQRWDCGFVGGLGLEYYLNSRWALQVESRCYYSTTSVEKNYQQIRDPKYNTTIALQAGVSYLF